MAGSAQVDDEDFIFDNSDPDTGAAGQADPSPPSDEGPRPGEPVDARLVSEAIRGLVPHGRDAAPAPAPAAAPAAPAQGPQPDLQTPTQGNQQGQQGDQQPLSPREQAFYRELRQERQRRQELEQRLNPQGQQQQRDIGSELFENPEAVIGELRQNFAQEIARVRLENDLDRAADKHGETFTQAFNSFMQQVGNGQDANTYFRVMNARSPGEEIVRWHRQQSVLQEVGEDPTAFRERVRQELLAEMQAGNQAPAATPRQAAVAEAPRTETGQFAPRHQVRLPTATGRMGGAVAAAADTGEDGSEDAIFGEASRRR